MDMQNVLDKLKQIENPTEDTSAAIKSAEAMTKAPEPAVAETVSTTATGEGTYTEYTPAEPADYAKLAGVPTLAVQSEPTNESVETEEEVLTESVEEEVIEEEVEEIEVHEDDAQEEEVVSEDDKGSVEVISWVETNGGQTEAILLRKGDEYALATDLANMDYEGWRQVDIEDHWQEYVDTAERLPGHGVYHWKSKDEFKKWATDNTSTYAKNIKFGVNFREPTEEVVSEGPTRKDFQMVADLIKNAEPAKKAELAQHHADVFAKQNPRFDKERFMAACGVTEAIFDPFEKDIPSPTSDDPVTKKMEEAYDPQHVAGIIKKHEQSGHEVEMDPYKDDEAGFTVTFKDGKRRHYKYTTTGTKVTSLEPVDPLVDPDAPKRGKGRPKKEAVEEVEVDELTRQFESKLSDLLPKEEVVTESAEQINESINVSQTINDEGQESVNINAQGNPEHIDMVKQLLQLAGQPRGYEEYTGEPEPEAEEANEELANAPDVKHADVDTQLNKQSGGLNGPKDKSALRGDSVKLHDDKDLAESLLDLYKEYKG